MANESQAKLLTDTESLLESVKSYNGDRTSRLELAKRLELLRLQVEDPMDSMISQWAHLSVAAAANVMVQLGVFEKLPPRGSMTASQLAAAVGKDDSIIIRFMRLLTASGIVAEVGEDEYAHTPKSFVYRKEAAADFFGMSMNMMPAHLKVPEYLQKHPLTDMVDIHKTPYSYAYGEGKTYYEILSEKPETLDMFTRAMTQQEATLPVLGMFPFLTLQKEVEVDKDRAFVVDVGGGRGQSLRAIQKETNGGFGAKMLLQDLQHVLDSVPEEEIPGIEKMVYDFFTTKPVKNAYVYYFRRIMHNYQDATCIEILKNTASAMSPRSRLLIGEMVVPDKASLGSDLAPYWMDMAILAIGGKERSEKEFAKVLKAAGLKLVKVWPAEVGTQAIIEAVLENA